MSKAFQVYRSSAGSGKTHTLVREYLQIVLRDPASISAILAITFTNAAATEMKERIIRELGHIHALKDQPDEPQMQPTSSQIKGREMLRQIMAAYKDRGEDSLDESLLIARAGQVLKNILHRYGDFSVSTIDSFVHRIVRSFAFDLRIPFSFDVEINENRLLNQSVDILLSQAGSARELTQVLTRYILHQAGEEKDIRIETRIARLAKMLLGEDGGAELDKLKAMGLTDFLRIARKLKHALRQEKESISRTAASALDLIHSQGLEAADFYRGKSGIHACFAHWADGALADRLLPNKTTLETIENDRWYPKSAAPAKQQKIDSIRSQLAAFFGEITGENLSRLGRYRLMQALSDHIYPVAVLHELKRIMDRLRREHQFLHISDFNKTISAIVSEQPVPFIYERLGEKFKHYMVDEFQDTSTLQWQNLLPLITNGLAGGHMSLVVGDGKQAIYRFRSGNVQQFTSLPDIAADIHSPAKDEWQQSLRYSYQPRKLDTNYRSHQAIVDFNNRFFTCLKESIPPGLENIYDEVAQKSLPKKTGGGVRVQFIGKQEEQSQDEAHVGQVLDIVAQCLELGHRPGDIAVLCRQRSKASLVARQLTGRQIPVISADSLLLGQSDAVNLILAVLKLIIGPEDQAAATEILGLLHRMGMLKSSGCLHDLLQSAGLCQQTAETGNAFRPMLQECLQENGWDLDFSSHDHLNLHDACESVIRLFFAGQEPVNPFVAAFSDAVFDYSKKNTRFIPDFLEWWEENGVNLSLSTPAGVDAVQVMTIHKSKGLQFPVVIYPFAHEKTNTPTRDGLWANPGLHALPELETAWVPVSEKALGNSTLQNLLADELNQSYLDALNLVYVACTRPSEKLFVISNAPGKEESRAVNGLFRDFLRQEGLWEAERDTYEFGDTQAPPAMASSFAPAHPGPFNAIISRSWHGNLRMRSHQLERGVLLDLPDPLERGNLIHRAMERIGHAGEVEEVLEHMVRTGEIDESTCREWARKIRTLLQLPEVAPYFREGLHIKYEAGIIDRDGSFYRPDRVILGEGEAVVMEYKSGKAYQRHREQMATYAELLHAMGYPRVKKLILYLDQLRVETV